MNKGSTRKSFKPVTLAVGAALVLAATGASAHGNHHRDRHHYDRGHHQGYVHCDLRAHRKWKKHRHDHRDFRRSRHSVVVVPTPVQPSYSYQQPYYPASGYGSGYHGASPNFGNAVGGALGGYLGAQFGKGSGKLAATAAGAVIGYQLGGNF